MGRVYEVAGRRRGRSAEYRACAQVGKVWRAAHRPADGDQCPGEEKPVPKTTADKLGIKPGSSLKVINAPGGQAAVLGPLPEGTTLDLKSGGDPADVVVLFAHDSGELHRDAPAAL